MPTPQQHQAAAYLVHAVSAEWVEKVQAILESGASPNIPMEVKNELHFIIPRFVFPGSLTGSLTASL